MKEQIAIVYQAGNVPEKDGIVKPMKPGGYSDSGADIAYSLRRNNVTVITPVTNPEITHDYDWVFPDTAEGIQDAINSGANIIWLNTVLYENHPIKQFLDKGIAVVGQAPEYADRYDDKLVANKLLKEHGLPIPEFVHITANNVTDFTDIHLNFPVVAKPIRGRGSEGVTLVQTKAALQQILDAMFASQKFGNALYVEAYLPGDELTITVMPPGMYTINGTTVRKSAYWSLRPVKRFNHVDGIAPYNGTVAVVNNSISLNPEEIAGNTQIQKVCTACEKAAQLVQAKAPIRIDCRADSDGKYYLFDLNMKPNMTGASRPHRTDQDSLTALAVRSTGWSFDELTLNMMKQHWQQ